MKIKFSMPKMMVITYCLSALVVLIRVILCDKASIAMHYLILPYVVEDFSLSYKMLPLTFCDRYLFGGVAR